MKISQYCLLCISIFFIFPLLLLVSCGTETEDNPRYFQFTHESDDINYTFTAQTSDDEVIAKIEEELERPFNERSMHINGPITRGEVDYNSGWSWYFVENEWDLVTVSAEVCDGRPSFVEEDLDYWVDQVGRFCPWSSRVEAEVNM